MKCHGLLLLLSFFAGPISLAEGAKKEELKAAVAKQPVTQYSSEVITSTQAQGQDQDVTLDATTDWIAAGEKSNINAFGASQAGQITEITNTEKGETMVTIVNSDGVTTSQKILSAGGSKLLVKVGDWVTLGQPLQSYEDEFTAINAGSANAAQAGQITEITNTEIGETMVTIVNSDGVTTSQTFSAGGSKLLVKVGDWVKQGQPLQSYEDEFTAINAGSATPDYMTIQSQSQPLSVIGAAQAGQITGITTTETGETKITMVNTDGVTTTTQTLPAGSQLLVKVGEWVKSGQPLNSYYEQLTTTTKKVGMSGGGSKGTFEALLAKGPVSIAAADQSAFQFYSSGVLTDPSSSIYHLTGTISDNTSTNSHSKGGKASTTSHHTKPSTHSSKAKASKMFPYYVGPFSCPQQCLSGATTDDGILEANNVKQCDANDKNQEFYFHDTGPFVKIEVAANLGYCLGVSQEGGLLGFGAMKVKGMAVAMKFVTQEFINGDRFSANLKDWMLTGEIAAMTVPMFGNDGWGPDEVMCNSKLQLVDCTSPAANWYWTGAQYISSLCWSKGYDAVMQVSDDCSHLKVTTSDASGADDVPITLSQTFMLIEAESGFIDSIVPVPSSAPSSESTSEETSESSPSDSTYSPSPTP